MTIYSSVQSRRCRIEGASSDLLHRSPLPLLADAVRSMIKRPLTGTTSLPEACSIARAHPRGEQRDAPTHTKSAGTLMEAFRRFGLIARAYAACFMRRRFGADGVVASAAALAVSSADGAGASPASDVSDGLRTSIISLATRTVLYWRFSPSPQFCWSIRPVISIRVPLSRRCYANSACAPHLHSIKPVPRSFKSPAASAAMCVLAASSTLGFGSSAAPLPAVRRR
jgi:hypothetical protein